MGADLPAGGLASTWAAIAAMACMLRWKSTLSEIHSVAVATTTTATIDAMVRGST